MTSRFSERAAVRDLLLLLGAQLAVGSAAILARFGLSGGLSPGALACWRLGFASAALLVFRFARSPEGAPDRAHGKDRFSLLLAGAILAFHFAAWFRSLELIPVARSTLLVCTVPVWSELGGMLFQRRRSSWRFWGGLAVVLFGVWLLVASGSAADSASFALGDLWAILGAVSMAAYLMLAEGPRARLGARRTIEVTYPAAFAALVIWETVAAGFPGLPDSTSAWIGVLGMALVPQLLGHTGMNWALKRFTPSEVAISTLLEPGIAAILAWVLLAEPMSSSQAAGLCLTTAGIALSIDRRRGV